MSRYMIYVTHRDEFGSSFALVDTDEEVVLARTDSKTGYTSEVREELLKNEFAKKYIEGRDKGRAQIVYDTDKIKKHYAI